MVVAEKHVTGASDSLSIATPEFTRGILRFLSHFVWGSGLMYDVFMCTVESRVLRPKNRDLESLPSGRVSFLEDGQLKTDGKQQESGSGRRPKAPKVEPIGLPQVRNS